jgi:pimeloyl-ACP methyl ester carboxylesterase
MKRLLPTLLLLASCATVAPPREFIDGPQGRIHIDDGGRGRATPVIFVHGNGANLEQWRAQLDHVRATRRAVALDLRGMGRSDPARSGDYSVAGMAEDVDAVANALGLKRFILVGHSYGGAVVGMYASKHPDRVGGIVFADSASQVKMTDKAAENFARAIRKDRDAVVKQWFAPMLAPSSDAVRETVYAAVRQSNVDAFVGALTGMRDIDMAAVLEAYPGPKVAIGAADIEGPASFSTMFSAIPVHRIKGTGHWLMLDKPAEFNAMLDEALKTIDQK